MKKRILFVIESLVGGGAEKVLLTVLQHIDRTKFDVTLTSIVGAGKYSEMAETLVDHKPIMSNPEKLSAFGKAWYTLKYKLVYRIFPVSLVYRLFIPKGYDFEIAFCEGLVTKLIAASTNRKAKKIAWVHTDLKHYPWPQKIGVYKNIDEERDAYGKYDNIIVVSKSAEKSFREIYGLEETISTIYNPIDVEDIRNKAIIVKANKQDIFTIITIGRFVYAKGYDILLKVINRLKNEGLVFKLQILGYGEQQNVFERYIQENNLTEFVEMLGFQYNPYAYLCQADLFVCSSRAEGYSLVIAEALALGIPVISTYCSGPNELLDEGKYGMLVENNEDGTGLFLGLKQLLSEERMLAYYKQKAIERGNHFSLRKIMEEIESVIID